MLQLISHNKLLQNGVYDTFECLFQLLWATGLRKEKHMGIVWGPLLPKLDYLALKLMCGKRRLTDTGNFIVDYNEQMTASKFCRFRVRTTLYFSVEITHSSVILAYGSASAKKT